MRKLPSIGDLISPTRVLYFTPEALHEVDLVQLVGIEKLPTGKTEPHDAVLTTPFLQKNYIRISIVKNGRVCTGSFPMTNAPWQGYFHVVKNA